MTRLFAFVFALLFAVPAFAGGPTHRVETVKGRTARSGTDVSGGNVTVAAGEGRGTGTGSVIMLKVPFQTASGGTLQTLTVMLTISEDGGIVVTNGTLSAGIATFSSDVTITGGTLAAEIATFSGDVTVQGTLALGGSADLELVRASASSLSVTNGSGGFSTVTALRFRSNNGATRKLTLAQTALDLASDAVIFWRNGANSESGSVDVGLARAGAGILRVTDGGAGDGDFLVGGSLALDASAGAVNFSAADGGTMVISQGMIDLGTDNLSVLGGNITLTQNARTVILSHTGTNPVITTNGGEFLFPTGITVGDSAIMGLGGAAITPDRFLQGEETTVSDGVASEVCSLTLGDLDAAGIELIYTISSIEAGTLQSEQGRVQVAITQTSGGGVVASIGEVSQQVADSEGGGATLVTTWAVDTTDDLSIEITLNATSSLAAPTILVYWSVNASQNIASVTVP